MLISGLLIFGLAHCSLATPLSRQCSDDIGIQLATGRYVGTHNDETSITTYYAIPYAYASRFEVSKPIETKPGISSGNVVNASTHGPSCIQFNLPPPYDKGFSLLLGGEPIEPQSEECLNVDVYVPDGHHKDLPVLVFTPGGGFLVGASFPYDMSDLITRAVAIGKPFIAVVINYRLGPLGFLNPSTWDPVNLGLLDQVEALRWVRKYIFSFGGNPDMVTIAGQSAGGESTMHQLLWTNESLFRSAWMMSVPSAGGPFLSTQPEDKNELVQSYAKACGCPRGESIAEAVDCLRKTDVSVLTKNSIAWEGSMTSLGGFVRNNVFETIRAGNFPKVPIMLSMCRDEGTAQAIGYQPNDTETTALIIQNAAMGRGLAGNRAAQFLDQMLEAYPNDPTLGSPFDGKDTNYGQGSQYKRMSAIATDLTYTEAWVEYLETFSAAVDVWGLEWAQPIYGAPPELGVVHAADLLYYFPSLLGPELQTRAYINRKLKNVIQEALINFVSDGDPSGNVSGPAKSDRYHWPSYSNKHEITVLSVAGAKAEAPPNRPGFDVIHKFLRPGRFRKLHKSGP